MHGSGAPMQSKGTKLYSFIYRQKRMNAIFVAVFLFCWSSTTGTTTTESSLLRNVVARDQQELDQLLIYLSSQSSNTPMYVKISFAGDTFRLDVVELMRVHFTSLTMIGSGGRRLVNIDCVGGQSDLEVLRNNLLPLSNVSLVLIDRLVFTKCPVPLLIEEASTVVIKNCVFRYVIELNKK